MLCYYDHFNRSEGSSNKNIHIKQALHNSPFIIQIFKKCQFARGKDIPHNQNKYIR